MDTNLIIIILTVAFWIISAIISSNKKKVAAQQQQNPSTFDNDPYKTAEHSTDDFRETTEPWSYDSQIVDETTRRMPMDIISEHRMNKLDRDEKPNKLRQSSDDVEIHSPETEKSDILDDFNLRDAIIYSELLKPKFED